MFDSATSYNALVETSAFLVLLLPLLSFFISICISDRYSWVISLVSTLFLLAASVCAGVIISQHWNETPYYINVEWFTLSNYKFSANLVLTNESSLMLLVVSIISFLVHFYSIGYMAGDSDMKRYYAMLGFFTFSMQGIVLADSLLLIFVFWELVGFSSYMLIGHYMQRVEAAQASKKAFLMNRIGDVGFLIGLLIIWTNTGTFNLSEIVISTEAFSWQTAASLCLFCGVIGKSAQFPLFTWLPDAMEGPTPVSALIHAATMVAAGVYLMTRIYPLFTSESLDVVAVVGMTTALIGSVAAISAYDIKKILAYSTISQLGLMITAVGMGLPGPALLHLFTHAFFKACLFLSAGAIIHALHQAQQQSHQHFDVQDIRLMGGLRKKLPITFMAFLLSGASLAGIPFFSGFLSKEAIIAAVWMHSTALSWFILTGILGVSFLTVMYTFRLIWSVFMGEARQTDELNITEVPPVMRVPMILLAVSSLWFMVSWNPFDFMGWFLPISSYNNLSLITTFSVVWIAIALLLSWLLFKRNRFKTSGLLRNAFYIDNLYQYASRKTVFPLATATMQLDRKWIDGAIHAMVYGQVIFAHAIGWFDRTFIDGTVHTFARIARMLGGMTRSFQGGKIQHYIFWSIFTIIIFLIWTLN